MTDPELDAFVGRHRPSGAVSDARVARMIDGTLDRLPTPAAAVRPAGSALAAQLSALARYLIPMTASAALGLVLALSLPTAPTRDIAPLSALMTTAALLPAGW